MKNKSYVNLIKGLAAIFIMAVLLLMNGYKQNVIELNLTGTGILYNGMETYEPHLSLPKGDYQITANGYGKAYVLYCNTQGDVLGMTEAGPALTVSLDKDQSDILVCSDLQRLSSVRIEKEGWIFKDTLIIAALLTGFVTFALYKRLNKKDITEKDVVTFLIMGIVLVVSYPLYTQTILYGHDINFHLYRIEGIKDGLLAGQFPVRIHPTHNNEYGYITASVYPELFLYIPAIFRLMGASNVLSYHIFVVFINAITAICMYIAAKGIAKSSYAGCLASVIYTFSTWRVINLYYRAAIGEALAMAFFPLLFYGLYCILKGNEKKWWVFTFACTGIFMSHIISTMVAAGMVVLFLLLYCTSLFEKKRFIALLKSGVTTVLLNAWFLAGFCVYYLGLDLFIKHKPENTEFFQNAIYPVQLFNLFGTNFGTSNLLDRGIIGEMSLTPGVGVTLCLLLSLGYYLVSKKNKERNVFARTMFYVSVCLILVATTLFPWEVFQKSQIINLLCGTMQFPWRLLSVASAMIVIVAVTNLEELLTNTTEKKATFAIAVVVSVLAFAVWGNAYTMGVPSIIQRGQAVSTSGHIGWDNEYFRTGTNIGLFDRNQYRVCEGVQLVSYDKSGSNVSVVIDSANAEDWVEVPLLNYPGYKAKDEHGNRLEVVDGTNNFVRVILSESANEITIYYGSFWYLRVAEVVSILTLGYLLFTYYKYRKREA